MKETQRLARKALGLYTPEVEALIAEESRDAKHIEHLLDVLLDFAFNPDILLLYHENFSDKSSALKREAQIKGWSRAKKKRCSRESSAHCNNWQSQGNLPDTK